MQPWPPIYAKDPEGWVEKFSPDAIGLLFGDPDCGVVLMPPRRSPLDHDELSILSPEDPGPDPSPTRGSGVE
jgi:hypothetical protein